jgi:membrane associated rhomboid family serine protease
MLAEPSDYTGTEAVLIARSEKQAMDWGLVLASQGIEAGLNHIPETNQWVVIVSAADELRAREAIALYELENRNRRWQHEIKVTGLFYDWRSLLWIWVWILVDWASFIGTVDLAQAGRMDAGAVAGGQWWRLFTATTLHADLGHLLSNATLGALMLGLAMGCYGAGPASLAALLAGAAGNFINLIFRQPPFYSLGASGVVMGALGLLTVNSLALLRMGQPSKLVARGLFAGGFLLILYGFNPGSDVVAHVGGFIGGCVAGIVLVFLPARIAKSPAFDRFCWVATAILLVASWMLALAGAGK